MYSLTEFIVNGIKDEYSLNEQTMIKTILFMLKSDKISAKEFVKSNFNKDIKNVDIKEIVDFLIKNSMFRNTYNKDNRVKKLVLREKVDTEYDEDEIFNI